jgi:simple sugar transport system ATP-binding protein
VGREVAFDTRKASSEPGSVVLQIDDLNVTDDRGLPAVRNLSLNLREGEVLGIAGVDGNGQKELCEAIAGLRSIDNGEVKVDGQSVHGLSAAERRKRLRMGFVPEDRHASGLDIGSSVALNTVLRGFRERPFSRYGWVDFKAIRDRARDLVQRYDVRLRSIDQTVRDLSGGNQQKIILAREIEDKPRLLVVSQATKGLDVGAIEFVQKALMEQCAAGMAILYVSTELEDLLQVSDRVAVIYEGTIVGMVDVDDATPEALGLLMAGRRA